MIKGSRPVTIDAVTTGDGCSGGDDVDTASVSVGPVGISAADDGGGGDCGDGVVFSEDADVDFMGDDGGQGGDGSATVAVIDVVDCEW